MKTKGVILLIFMLTAIDSSKLMASITIDSMTGEEQPFTAGYSEKSFAQSFHSSSTYKIEKLRLPKNAWVFRKDFAFSALYDSNISATRQTPKDDMIYGYSPTFTLSRRLKYINLQILYNLSYSDHVENHKSDHTNHTQLTSINFKRNRWTINFTNSFKPDTAFATGEKTELDTTNSGRVISYADGLVTSISYDFSKKTKLSFDYNLGVFYFPEKDNSSSAPGQSTATHKFTPKLSYAITPRLGIYTSYEHEKVDYYLGGAHSSKANSGHIGITGKLTEKVSANADFGYRKREYTNSETLSNDGLVIQAGINRKITNKISGTLSMTHDVGENFDAIQSQKLYETTDFYGLNLSYLFSPKLHFDFSGNYGIISKEGPITLTDIENPTLTFTREQEDIFIDWSGTLSWSPRPYTSFLLGYKAFKKNSSFKNFEFDDKKVVASGNIKF